MKQASNFRDEKLEWFLPILFAKFMMQMKINMQKQISFICNDLSSIKLFDAVSFNFKLLIRTFCKLRARPIIYRIIQR